MSRPPTRWLAAAGITTIVAIAAAPALAGKSEPTSRGPSTKTDPYVLPVASGVSIKSLLSVGDKTGDYAFVGIPDGIGAAKGEDGAFDLFLNHELRDTQGVKRKHGQIGAFVSKYSIDAKTFEVKQGEDLIKPDVTFWDYPTQTYGTTPSAAGPNPRNPADTFLAQKAIFARFCSASLTDKGQLYNNRSGRGYDGRIQFANEENGDEGRTFGVTTNGEAQQLQRLGLFSWENTLAADTRSDTTLVAGDEDSSSGQLWLYHGTKRKTGNAFAKAGLTNGVSTVLDLDNEAVSNDKQFREKYGKGKPAEFDLANVEWDQSGAAQNKEALADGLTLNRIEDGAWDPKHRNDFYFVTTEGGKGADTPTGLTGRDGGGLWKVSFEDVDRPELGGTIELLLDGSEEPKLNKPDNLDIDTKGNILIQEDAGENVHVGRIVAYDIKTGKRGVVAQFDEALFAPATPGGTDAKLTIDEESSGIIDAREVLGSGWWLFDAQVHKANPDPELVEEGQLLALKVKDWDTVYDID